jgi:hypothetical protein
MKATLCFHTYKLMLVVGFQCSVVTKLHTVSFSHFESRGFIWEFGERHLMVVFPQQHGR